MIIDGWNCNDIKFKHFEDLVNKFYVLDQELTFHKKGYVSGCKTYSKLADYTINLANKLIEAAEEIKDCKDEN